jgi:uncharacterized membrane protein
MHHLFAQVIWALGWSMIVLARLIFLPQYLILLFALVTIGGHNLFDYLQPHNLQAWSWLWTLLHAPGYIEFLPGYSFFVLYPLIPWTGVMAAGYCFGRVFLQPESTRRNVLLWSGLLCLIAFIGLRLHNGYGDAHPWLQQPNGIFTFFSFINCEKYPPSLLYLLMTIGIMLIGLTVFESKRLQYFSYPLIIFGKVPMFFYLAHLLMIHGTMLIVTWCRSFPVDWLFSASFPTMPVADYGYDLGVVYSFWLLFLLLLYPLCYRYALLKQKSPESPWVRYL